jgi:hypothetical protein
MKPVIFALRSNFFFLFIFLTQVPKYLHHHILIVKLISKFLYINFTMNKTFSVNPYICQHIWQIQGLGKSQYWSWTHHIFYTGNYVWNISFCTLVYGSKNVTSLLSIFSLPLVISSVYPRFIKKSHCYLYSSGHEHQICLQMTYIFFAKL